MLKLEGRVSALMLRVYIGGKHAHSLDNDRLDTIL